MELLEATLLCAVMCDPKKWRALSPHYTGHHELCINNSTFSLGITQSTIVLLELVTEKHAFSCDDCHSSSIIAAHFLPGIVSSASYVNIFCHSC